MLEATWLLLRGLCGLCRDSPVLASVPAKKKRTKGEKRKSKKPQSAPGNAAWGDGLMHPVSGIQSQSWDGSHQLDAHLLISVLGDRDPSGSRPVRLIDSSSASLSGLVGSMEEVLIAHAATASSPSAAAYRSSRCLFIASAAPHLPTHRETVLLKWHGRPTCASTSGARLTGGKWNWPSALSGPWFPASQGQSGGNPPCFQGTWKPCHPTWRQHPFETVT